MIDGMKNMNNNEVTDNMNNGVSVNDITYNPDKRMGIEKNNSDINGIEKYDPDKRIETKASEVDHSETTIKDIRESVNHINEKLSEMDLEDIISVPYNSLVSNVNDMSLDSVLASSTYATACKLKSADLVSGKENTDKTDKYNKFIKNSLLEFLAEPELVNKYIQEYGIGPDILKEVAGQQAELVFELAKGYIYITDRLCMGVVRILDNACRAVYSMGLYALGKSDLAKDVMTESKIDEFVEFLDKTLQPTDIEKRIGDTIDKVGEGLGEFALLIAGAVGIAELTPAFTVGVILCAGVLAFDEAGKKLEDNVEKSGEYGKKEFLSALSTAGLTIVVERMFPVIGKIASEANVVKIAEIVQPIVKGNVNLGGNLVRSIGNAFISGAGMAVFKGTEEIQKIIDYALDINDKFDVKKEILETVGFVGGAAALGGAISFVGSAIAKSEFFTKIIREINPKYSPEIMDINDYIYQEVEYINEYISELEAKGVSKEALSKLTLEPGKVYKELSSEVKGLRESFKNNKNALIKEWEQKYNKEWPRYAEDVIIETKQGVKAIIRKAGDLFDAHHLVPLSLGGANTYDNIEPLHALEHFDHYGIHKDGGPLSKLIKLLGGEL
ncbi:MAG: HNH endonuclease [Lachnospiraceae bacterium]|nr:HNH endonuclease [Lachnospiraceae bacterium]